jgi:hypothetical protein
MSKRATTYIGLTVATGTMFLGAALGLEVRFPDLSAFMCYFALALLTSSWKVRLPGLNGTISVNFLFVLIAIAAFSFTETVLLASAACVVQCLWRARKQPKLIQVAFNVSTLAISSGLAYRAAHAITDNYRNGLPVLVALAACFYFTSNTLLVSGVLSLVEDKPLLDVWRQCYLWSFPYYLVGAAIAAAIVFCGRTNGWAVPLLIMPLMWMVFLFYRTCIQRLAQPAR